MEITENMLRIRKTIIGDAEILYEWWNNRDLMIHVGFSMGLNISKDKIVHQIKSSYDKHLLILEFENVPIGEANYIEKNSETVEIGIKIGCIDLQNKGYGALFIKLMASTLFKSGYSKIILDVDSNNKRAQHVYEKIGFKKTGVHHNTWTDQLGNPRGHIDYELLKAHFAAA